MPLNLQWLRDFVVEEVPDTAPQEEAQQPAPVTPPEGATRAQTASVRSRRVEEVDQKLMAELMAEVDSSNEPALGEFKRILESMRSETPDVPEVTLHKLAFGAAKASGMTLAKLRASFDDRFRILDREREEFDAHAAEQSESKVGTKRSELGGIEENIVERRKEIETLEARASELRAQIAAFTQRIGLAKARFSGAYEATRRSVQAEQERILQFLSKK